MEVDQYSEIESEDQENVDQVIRNKRDLYKNSPAHKALALAGMDAVLERWGNVEEPQGR